MPSDMNSELEWATGIYGGAVKAFLWELHNEISPYYVAGMGLLKEHQVFLSLCRKEQFSAVPTDSLLGAITYGLLLKQHEMMNASITAVISHNYVVCVSLIRSLFETNMFLIHLSKHPSDCEDFLAFAEVVCHPEVDWSSHQISRTRRELIEKKFGIRKMIRDLYAGTDRKTDRISAEHFYQQLCNATHPSLEPASLFYGVGAPPVRAFSSIGIRRTVIQLWTGINSAVEAMAGAIYRSQELLDECYQRRALIYECHRKATAWHAEHPDSEPRCSRNEIFRIGWKDGRPVMASVTAAQPIIPPDLNLPPK